MNLKEIKDDNNSSRKEIHIVLKIPNITIYNTK